MSDLNEVVLQGRLTKDAEYFPMKNGREIASFFLAVNRNIKKSGVVETETSFFNVKAFIKADDGRKNYLVKGQEVIASGRLGQKRWVNGDGENRSSISLYARILSIQFKNTKKCAEDGNDIDSMGTEEYELDDDLTNDDIEVYEQIPECDEELSMGD